MTNKEILKRKIIYRSVHRGTKEMDLILGNFVKMYINKFNNDELQDLQRLLLIDDDIIHKWYFDKDINNEVPKTNVSLMLKNFKL